MRKRSNSQLISPIVAMLVSILFSTKAWTTEEVSFPANEHPSYSPQGRQIAFASDFLGNSEIWIVSADGSNLTQLTRNPGFTQKDPSWSPDGSRIAFASDKSGSFNIWQIRPDGSGVTQLTTDPFRNEQPAWSPDGSRIAFASNRGGTRDIWIMNANGSNVQRLTSLAAQENHPSFSPAGDRLVFSESTERHSILMIMNSNGGGLRFLTTSPFRDLYPTWTSQGIVFSSNRDGRFAIWVIQPDGSGLRQLPNSRGGFDPAMSPDGTTIAFAGAQQDNSQNIAAINLSSGNTQQITNIKGFFIGILVKPGSAIPPPINIRSEGRIPVALLSRPNFDATTQVDRSSLTFGRTGDEQSLAFCNAGGEDVNGDGLPDLICHFDTPRAAFSPNDTMAILRGQATPSLRIEGRSPIRIVP